MPVKAHPVRVLPSGQTRVMIERDNGSSHAHRGQPRPIRRLPGRRARLGGPSSELQAFIAQPARNLLRVETYHCGMAAKKSKENFRLNALVLEAEHLESPRSRPSTEPELEFGRRLAALRESQHLSQEQLSAMTKAHDSSGDGLSRAVISMYERGKNRPSTRELRILCDTLRVTPSELLYGSTAPFEIDKWQVLNTRHSHALYFARWLYLFAQADTTVQLAIYELVLAYLRPTQAQLDALDGEARALLLRLAGELQQESPPEG